VCAPDWPFRKMQQLSEAMVPLAGRIERMPISKSLQEMLLVEHFRTELPLNVLDLAAWAQEFGEFSSATQLPWLPPVQLRPPGPFLYNITPATTDLPRVLLRSADRTRTLQLQSDRLAFGWARPNSVGENADYPGFEALKMEFGEISRRFNTWSFKRLALHPTARLAELAYNNATPMEVGGKIRKISDVFKFVNPGRPVNAFQVAWMELIDKERPDGARVSATVAIGSAPPVDRVLIHNFSGHAPVDGEDARATEKSFKLLHDRTLEMYAAAFRAE
jgi:hypothetical protein